jgi:Zn-dependent protease with chaperone function
MNFDFDFQRYVERRKGAREQQAREGAAYAYTGDLKVAKTINRLRPVGMALEGAVRLWRGSARAELLGPAVKVSETQFPRVHAAAQKCAVQLHISPPTVFVTPGMLAGGTINAYTFGTDDDASIVLHASLAEALNDKELADLLGRECGHVQNNHVLMRTALYFLIHSAGTFLRWIVKPAVYAIAGWSRRADLTADRAGLLCTRDLELSTVALAKMALGAQALEPNADTAKLIEANPELLARSKALKMFAEAAYYTGLTGSPSGLSQEECDKKVSELLK